MNINKELALAKLRIECYDIYIDFCFQHNTPPKILILQMIRSGKSIESLTEAKEIILNGTG